MGQITCSPGKEGWTDARAVQGRQPWACHSGERTKMFAGRKRRKGTAGRWTSMCKGQVSQGNFGVFWGAGLLLFRVHVGGGEMRWNLHLTGLGSDSLICWSWGSIEGFSMR